MKYTGRFSNYSQGGAVIAIAALGLVTTIGSGGGGVGIDPGQPIAKFTAQPTSGPAPLEVTFDASASVDPDGTIVSYQWYFSDDETTGSGVTVTHTFTTPGYHYVTLMVRDGQGKEGFTSTNITVEGSISAVFTAEPTSGVPPLEVAFDASASSDQDGTIVSYEWDFGDGESGTGVTTSHTYTSGGWYEVRLTVANDIGATNWATQDIKAGFPTAAFTAEPTSGVPPLKVTFDASTSYDLDGTIVRYEWSFGEPYGVATGVTATYTFTSRGSHEVILTVYDNEGFDDDAVQYIKVGMPTAAFSAQPTSGPAPLEVTFDASASYHEYGTIVSYHWNFGDGELGEGVTATHIYATPGTYTVALDVEDEDGFGDSASQNITVEAN